jgi:hypothetical protein
MLPVPQRPHAPSDRSCQQSHEPSNQNLAHPHIPVVTRGLSRSADHTYIASPSWESPMFLSGNSRKLLWACAYLPVHFHAVNAGKTYFDHLHHHHCGTPIRCPAPLGIFLNNHPMPVITVDRCRPGFLPTGATRLVAYALLKTHDTTP